MESRDLEFLQELGLRDTKTDAVYVLVQSPSGLLLEDMAPLLNSLETAYRRLLTLSVDSDAMQLLEERTTQKRTAQKTSLAGVSKSINVKYIKLLIPKEKEYEDADSYSDGGQSILLVETKTQNKTSAKPVRPYTPHRIEMARCQVSSPGFIELLGDPITMTLLVTLLGLLLIERRSNLDREERSVLSLRQSERDNIDVLLKMGFSTEEIQAVRAYLKEDISVILEALEESHCVLAPGDEVDPSAFEETEGDSKHTKTSID